MVTTLAALVALLAVAAGPAAAQGAVSCPNANPVVNENNCQGAGTTDWQVTRFSSTVAGFATQTSINKGQAVQLKIGRSDLPANAGKVDISVYRAGWYGGTGARLIPAAGKTNVVVNNTQSCSVNDAQTGRYSCANWAVTYTIPAASLPASGEYIVKLRTTDTNLENHIYFTLREDSRSPQSKMLFVVPTNDYAAYNLWGCKSLYFDACGGAATIAGTPRAVKVSFDRPQDQISSGENTFVGPDMNLLKWLERNGYDVSYTDDVQAAVDGASLKAHKAVLISGHSEYWTQEEFVNFRAARNAGVALATFGANTAYWKVRYENSSRTIVCFKTVQGDGSGGSGATTPNDYGPDGVTGTADDALGADGKAGTADDHPENSTTTFRDNGAPQGDPTAPPGGRVGPDLPENQLFGVMYVGDNDHLFFPLTVPAGAGGEYASDRDWRNTGLPVNASTSVGTDLVGWEWDAIPTQAQYLSRQPAGVKRLSSSNVQVASDNSWLQDEGRERLSIPPSGQPGLVSAVKYKASSGALVFAAGTMLWALGLGPEPDTRIQQATYNVFSDMTVQPLTPQSELVLDPTDGNQAPIGSFTLSSSPAHTNAPVTFDAAASTDPNGSIAKYEWDTDGDGTFDRNTGSVNKLTMTYTAEGTFNVRLRVTDNGGATDVTVRTVTVVNNIAPSASFTATPNPSVVGQTTQFNAGASMDLDGTIAKYEWDLDGNGSYETDTGTTKTTSRAYAAAGTVTVGLRVTDNQGKTGTATLPVTVNTGGVSNYGDAVLDTPGLIHYWRMGEATGTTLADSKGTAAATLLHGPLLKQPGGPPGDPNTAVQFDGSDDAGRAPVDLSSTQTLTVEFWLKWDAYANNDDLAMELTDNFNQNAGGFLVDPNATAFGGTFGVAMGSDSARNNAYFARPSAGVWHHYAFVLDRSQPGATQITPYVDGKAVSYQKSSSGTGGAFANANLWLMSRAGASLFGRGTLDELALYDRALGASAVAEHAASFGTNRRPVARLTATPNPVKTGVTVTFNGATSSDPDGTVKRYEWDLDGDGTYETDTGTTKTATRSYATEGDRTIGLRVTDDQFGSDTETLKLTVGNQPPTAVIAATPNPAITDLPTTFDASGSSDVDGTIAKYEWDLDGDGTYETSSTTSATATTTYTTAGTVPVGLRVTDSDGKTATATLSLSVGPAGVSRYPDAQLESSPRAYWRLGEASGTTLANAVAGGPAATAANVQLGVPGAIAGDSDTAARFDGTTSNARAAVNLSDTNQVTVEFWLKWTGYSGADNLAMELTDNFNGNDGGFVVDPNAPQYGGTFGVGLGRSGSRNNVFFQRASAGQWHHYALVMDSTAPAATQITPYVDGKAVSYSKLDSGTGAGKFANSTLWMMSRAGTSLFGQGDLDEVAVYPSALSPETIAEQYIQQGTNRRPSATFSASPASPGVNKPVTFDATGSADPDGTITHYQWDLDGNGSFETDTGTTKTVTKTYSAAGDVKVRLRVLDNRFGTDSASKVVSVVSGVPTAAFTASPSPSIAGDVVTFDASGSTDTGGGTITRYEWDLDGDGTYEVDGGASATTTKTFAAAGSYTIGLRVTDDEGNRATTTHTQNVKASSYSASVLGTSGLVSYWRMEETSGTTLADAKGSNPATTVGGTTLGVPGALAGAPSLAARFDGVDDAAAAAHVNLSTTTAASVEFWLKWNAFTDNDALALELTSNFNANDGGFLVDPNASTGTFGVGIGRDAARTAVSFARPTAGQWHHIVLVLDMTKPPAGQITPYIDGAAVSTTQTAAGSGGTGFANSTLYFMSRGAAALFGGGDLDELAVYDRALTPATIAAHYANGTP